MFTLLSPTTLSATAGSTPAADAPLVKITFDQPLSDLLLRGSGGQAGYLPITVKQLLPNNQALLQLPDGRTLTAQLNPQVANTPLSAGTQLLLQVTPNLLAQGAAITTSAFARLLTAQAPAAQLPPAAAAPAVQLPPAATAALPLTNLEPLLRQPPALANIPPGPVPTAPATLPAGPIQVIVAPSENQPLPPGPGLLQPTAPANAQGQQPALFFPIPAANQPPQQPIQVIVNAGQILQPDTHITVQSTTTGVLQLTTPLPVNMATAQPNLPLPQQLTLTPDPTQPLPSQPVAARVLGPDTPPNPALPAQQTVLLSTGQTARLTTPVPLPAGTLFTVSFSAPQPVISQLQVPQATVALPPQPALIPGQPITAQVSEQLPNHTLLLTITTPGPLRGQPLAVTTPAPLPPGTTLTLLPTPEGTLTVQTLAAPANAPWYNTLTSTGQVGGTWTQLATALTQLDTQSPAIAQKLREHLPQLAYLAPSLARYAEALTSPATPERWLGNETVSLLRSLGIDLTPDLTQLAALRQPGPEGWQGFVFPYLENPHANPQQGRFFWRRQKQEDTGSGNSHTRFVVELALSNLGDVQLDGLLSYPELWLKLRLHPPADTSFTADLQSTVNNLLQSIGLNGGLTVESTATFPVDTARFLHRPTTPTFATEL